MGSHLYSDVYAFKFFYYPFRSGQMQTHGLYRLFRIPVPDGLKDFFVIMVRMFRIECRIQRIYDMSIGRMVSIISENTLLPEASAIDLWKL